MKSFTPNDYLESGCILQNPNRAMLWALVNETQGRVCTTGCFVYQGGKCESYQKMISTCVGTGDDISGESSASGRRNETSTQRVIRLREESGKQNRTNTVPGYVKPASEAPQFRRIEYSETVAEEAQRTGVTKAEVRRRRNAEANQV